MPCMTLHLTKHPHSSHGGVFLKAHIWLVFLATIKLSRYSLTCPVAHASTQPVLPPSWLQLIGGLGFGAAYAGTAYYINVGS